MLASCDVELFDVLQRDHLDLDRALAALTDVPAMTRGVLDALEGLRLGLAAHITAEARVVHRACSSPALVSLLSQVDVAHGAQQIVLASLLAMDPGTPEWRDRLGFLRGLLRHHMEQEARQVLPAVRDQLAAEVYRSLARRYAIERVHALQLALAS